MANKAPSPPLGVLAAAGITQVIVSWKRPNDDGGSAITSYTVTSSPGNKTATTPDGNTLSAMVTGLTNGTVYTFTVKATNGAGQSPASAPSPAATPTAQSPTTNVVERLFQLSVTEAYGNIPTTLRSELNALATSLAVHNGLPVP
jgi:hypothetical protein